MPPAGDQPRSLYTRLVAGLVFPLHERLKGHDSVARRALLEQSQWWDAARLEDYRRARLREFLVHAGSAVPYYRDLFHRHGFDPAACDGTADLAALPLLDKATVRRAGDRLRADDAGPLARFNTGGSSGEPLVFRVGRDRVSHDVAARWRSTRWWGIDIGDREAVIWGSPVELGAQDRLRAARDRLLRSRLFPAFEMSAERMSEFLRELLRFRPAMLFGYPSAVARLARHALDTGTDMRPAGVRVAFVTGETIFPEQREAISAAFGCRVAAEYGARDAGFLARECPDGGMHLSAEDIIVETVNHDGQPVAAGEQGEIVVTHMATGDFPFIRYRTGDIGVLDDAACPCGRGLPLLREVKGRTTDFVTAADGTVMHGLALIYVVREHECVQAFRIEQQSIARTVVQLVPGDGYNAAVADTIRAGIGKRLGAGVEVVVEELERIPAEASGKHRYIVSRVASMAPAGAGNG